jgi:hypothetical protein
MSKQIRIATVKSTGRRYIVQQLCFRTNRVHCAGEVVRVHNLQTTHSASHAFAMGDVVVSETTKTQDLVLELFEQARAAARSGRLHGYAA